jgi:hypothetical protein
MSGEGHPAGCPDCVPCQECETRAAWCLSEHPVNRPCEHLEPICSECWPGRCVPCRLLAEREMFATATYSPAADPFFDHRPATEARDASYWDTAPWRDLGKGPQPEETETP